MDTFGTSSFGVFVMQLFQGLFTTPSWQTFTLLACGWALTPDRHTITTYLWLTGATTVKHFSRFYVFLGCPLYQARWQLWAVLIRYAARLVPAGEVIVIRCDDTTEKKAGTHIEGLDRYRNGAGSARQEYRTLRGLNFVLGTMCVPLRSFPSHSLSVPIGLELYLKAAAAQKLHVPPRTRSQLARDIVDFVAQQLPERSIRVLTDGGYAPKDFLRDLPESVHVVSRLLVSGTLYELPTPTGQKRRGAPRKKGPAIGSPKTLAHTPQGWQPHPTEAGAEVQAWCGLWHAVLPGHLIRVVVVRRTGPHQAKPGRRTKRPEVEAFFTTDLSLSLADLLQQYQNRWAVEIDIRDANAFYGLGQDQCRKRRRIIGANTFRLVMAAARTLWFIEHVEHTKTLQLGRYRPWYRHKCAPSQLDVVWTCREALQATGILPIPRFSPDLAVNQLAPDRPQRIVA